MNKNNIQSVLVQATLDLLPPNVRHSLLDDRAFLRKWNIATTTSLTLGTSGPTFRRDRLFDGIRSAIRHQGVANVVKDQGGREWQILSEPQGERLIFFVRAGGASYILIDHSALAEQESIRIGWFERLVQDKGFDGDTSEGWLHRLRQSSLSDEDFADLMVDVEQTPASKFCDLRINLGQANVDAIELVPHERRYYERLVGKLEKSTTVAEYIEAGAKARIASLQGGRSREGFKYALLMCSAGNIAECIRIDELDREELILTYQWLAEYGDPISRVGAVEIALSRLDVFPELSPVVERIVEGFLSDDPEDDGGSFALLCAMIVMVASELARKRTLGTVPPFYLRQAAIAHASLVIRAINASRMETASVTRWAQSMGVGQLYFLNGLIDLRSEPRWLPDFVGADQLRFEFLGRIANAANRNEGKIQIDSLRALLLGHDSKLANSAKWPFPNLPGPMEGAVSPGQPYPEELMREVNAALEADRLNATSFAGLVNAALLFDMQKWMADLAAAALRRVRFSIEDADDEDKTFSLIGGLAILASVTRSRDLADALRILTRVMRRRKRLSGAPYEEMRIAMIAAASFEDLEDWARFAGDWLTEIAFETTDKDAARTFLLKLRRLVRIEPALARYCASADAALDAFAH